MKKKIEIDTLFLLNDEPISTAEGDFLGRGGEAAAIAATVLGTEGPFTICICGEWGIGKTSFLRHVESLLEDSEPGTNGKRRHPNVITVFFNAWRYEDDPHPLAHLADLIRQRVSDTLQETDGFFAKSADSMRSLGTLLRAMKVGIEFKPPSIPGFGQLSVQAGHDPASVQKYLVDLKDSNVVISGHTKGAIPEAALRSIEKDSVVTKSRASFDEVSPRIVVFIDDLDRCQAQAALKILQSIKLAFSQPGCFFILSLDPERLISIDKDAQGLDAMDLAEVNRKIFLDKLVQLSFPLRLSPHRFSSFVDKLIDIRLRPKLPSTESDIFDKLRRLLEQCADQNPRSLIRRTNAVILDGRFIDRTQLQFLGDTIELQLEQFYGASLIGHTLRAFCSNGTVNVLSASQELCDAIVRHGLRNCANLLRTANDDAMTVEEGSGRSHGQEALVKTLQEHRAIILELNAKVEIDSILHSDHGKSWLQRAELRKLVYDLYFKGDIESQFLPGFYGAIKIPPKDQCGLILRAVTETLRIPADAPLSRADLGRITQLKFDNDPLSDEAIAYLSHKSSPMASLKELNLDRTKISDRSLETLANPECPFVLSSLFLDATNVTDAGIRAITSGASRLHGLKVLWIAHTHVTNHAVHILSAESSSIRALNEIYLWELPITDDGIAAMAKSARFAGLTGLYIARTSIGDAAVASMIAPDSVLANLQTLNLRGTTISDRGLRMLCDRDSALQSMRELCVDDIVVSKLALAELLKPEQPMSRLYTLYIRGVPIASEWLDTLGENKGCFPLLRHLFISDSAHIHAAVKRLRKNRRQLEVTLCQ